MTTQQSFDLAVRHHQAGRLSEAEALYRGILAQQPNHADALHLLGVIALQSGHFQAAADLIGRAISIQPREAVYHNNLGNAWLSLGKLDAAAGSFREALTLRPGYAEAHHNLGLALHRQGFLPEAGQEYRAAVELKPDYADAWKNLAILSLEQRQLAAANAFQEAIRCRPSDVDLHYGLGNALLDQDQYPEAAAAYQAAIELRPNFIEAHYNLGIALHREGRFEAAVQAYRAALGLRPDHAAAQGNLGKALLDLGQIEEAIEAFQMTLQLRPDHAETHFNLGNAWLRQEKWEDAASAFRTALSYKPAFPEALLNLGNVHQEHEQVDEAMDAYRAALEFRPDYTDVFNNLGGNFKRRGRPNEALEMYRKAHALKPEDATYHSNLIYHLHFHPGVTTGAIREELANWNERHAEPLRPFIRSHTNYPGPSRRLKVGYVSTDFRDHVIGRNLLPLLQRHDRSRFGIFCYADVVKEDAISQRFRACVDQWRDTIPLSDERLAEQIREDRIDILVDLSLHLAHHRLLVFARQPAPVQVTFAGYPGSTGVETIRYRLTDPYLDPPGKNDALYSEESIRLPDTFWCYERIDRNAEVNDLPALREGHVTFGCLNNFAKTNEKIAALWARVLVEVPDSRLLVLAPPGQCRRDFSGFLQTQGVEPSRVEFLTKSPRTEYLRWHHRIDLILDTFPYNGHTTSLDALWMGVPVISLTGEHAVSRAGFSQMSNLGLLELVASSPDEYVQIAGKLARDLPRLAALRATLRTRMQSSPLMDAERFTRNIEATYRRLWQRWCEKR